jgi:hypothetical protein
VLTASNDGFTYAASQPISRRVIKGPTVLAVALLAYAYAIYYIGHQLPDSRESRLVSVRELDNAELLQAICESVEDDALSILERHQGDRDAQGRLTRQVSAPEGRVLWLADHSCWYKAPRYVY